MKRLNTLWIFVFVLGFFITMVFAQTKMWVTSERAKLKAESRASSKTITSLPIGTKVMILGSQKKWYHVRAPSGTKGWMYRGRLSKSPPKKEVEGDTGNLFAVMSGSGIGADEVDAGRSIRGLSSETEAYANKRGTPGSYRKALDRVLALSVTEKELGNFLRKGKIGEYAP